MSYRSANLHTRKKKIYIYIYKTSNCPLQLLPLDVIEKVEFKVKKIHIIDDVCVLQKQENLEM